MYKLIRIVGDRHAAFILAMIVVVNLIVGSLVMNHYPDLYPKFFHLDLNYFFHPVRAEHSWLYALLVTFSLFGINLLACIIDSVTKLVVNKGGRLKEISALLFHVALLITMVAHLVEGFYATTQQLPITTEGMQLPELGNVKVESLRNIFYPDGSLKDTEVALSFAKPDGQRIAKDIAFNEPATFDKGRRQVVMMSGQMAASGAVLQRTADNREFIAEVNKPLILENGSLLLWGFFDAPNGLPYAHLLWRSREGAIESHFMMMSPESPHSQIRIGGASYRFIRATEAPYIIAIVRYNPAIPLMAVSLMLSFVGTVLLIRWLATRGNS